MRLRTYLEYYSANINLSIFLKNRNYCPTFAEELSVYPEEETGNYDKTIKVHN